MTVLIMTCDDAREGLSLLSSEGMGLTEWVLADAHMRQCAACREALEDLPQRVSSGQRVTPHYALLRWVAARIDASRSGITRVVAWVTRVMVLLAITLTALGLRVAGAINASRVGAMWVVDPLTHVRLPRIWALSVRTAAMVVVSTGLGMTRVAGVLAWSRSSLWVTRAAAGVIEAVRAAGSWCLGFFIQVSVFLPTIVAVSVRIAAGLIGGLVTGFAHRLSWCRSSLGGLSQWPAEAAIRVWCSGIRLRERSSANAARTTRVVIALTGRRIAIGCTRARRVVALCTPVDLTGFFALPVQAATKAIEVTATTGRLVMATCGHALRRLGQSTWTFPICRRVWNTPTIDQLVRSVRALAVWRASLTVPLFLTVMRRSLGANRGPLGLCTGVVCLAAFIAATPFLWPRQWPVHLIFQPTPERLSQQPRQPTDPRPADLGTAELLAEPSIADISVLRAAPTLQPKTRRVAPLPNLPAAEAAIPTPARRRGPAAAQASASAPVPTPLDGPWAREALRTPQTGVQHAEAPDASAAIDWLVKRGREPSRRSIEIP